MCAGAERIGFSLRLSAMYVELLRLASSFVHDDSGLTLTEWEVVVGVAQSPRPLRVRELADFLVLEVATLWQLIPRLLDEGLVGQASDGEDRRMLLLVADERQRLHAADCFRSLSRHVAGITLRYLPTEEFDMHMARSIGASLDVLRGHPADVSLPVAGGYLRLEFLVFARVIIDRWRAVIRRSCGRSLSEFRVLDALCGSQRLRVQDLSELLLLARSQVSACRRALDARGLVRTGRNPLDGRSVLLAATEKGRSLVAGALPALDELTERAHRPDTEGGVMVLDAWHARMYYNLKRYHEETGGSCGHSKN